MIVPRVIFIGDPAAATPWVGIAKKLALECYAFKISHKIYQLGFGVTIRVENIFPSSDKLSGICKVWVEAVVSDFYSFIFLPKLIFSYTHPEAGMPPWPLPNSVPVLPTVGTDIGNYQAIYKYKIPKPPKTDWMASVDLLNRNETYGNQNFFHNNDIYSWWHSPGGDLSVGLMLPEMFEWLAAQDISVFPVNDKTGATVAKSGLERLPCYTPGMTYIDWYDDETEEAYNDPKYLYGYFIESDERYYWYQLKPLLYKNNEPYIDYSQGFNTFICGFYTGNISILGETNRIEIIAVQENSYETLGDVDVFISVKNVNTGDIFTKRIYDIFNGTLVLNALNWPIRFSENGLNAAGLFHCADSGNRGVGYFGEHILLAEFSINYEEQDITLTNSERFKYTDRRFGGGVREETPEVTDTWYNVNHSYDSRFVKGTYPCQSSSGEDCKQWQHFIDDKTTNTIESGDTDNTEITGTCPLALNYKNNSLLRAGMVYDLNYKTMYNSVNVEWDGMYAEVWSADQPLSRGNGAPNSPTDSIDVPNIDYYDQSDPRTYTLLNNGNYGCVGWVFRGKIYGVSKGVAPASFREQGTKLSDTRGKTRKDAGQVSLEITGETSISIFELDENETTNYNRLYKGMTTGVNENIVDEWRNLTTDGYGNHKLVTTTLDGTTDITTTYWQYYREEGGGVTDNYDHGGELISSISMKHFSFLDLKSKIMVYVKLDGNYHRTATSNRLNQDIIKRITIFEQKTGQDPLTTISTETIVSDESNSSGIRTSSQTMAIVLKNYGDGSYERYLAEPQTVSKTDDFLNSSFINNSINFSAAEDYDLESQYDFSPNDVFTFMDLYSSRSVATRLHHKTYYEYNVYLASLFDQVINFYYEPRDNTFGQYFPNITELYSYQLKGIDTNVPVMVGNVLQDPENPKGVNIGNQLCPIGFVKL